VPSGTILFHINTENRKLKNPAPVMQEHKRNFLLCADTIN